MTWQPYVVSLVLGLGVGAIYGGLDVKSPAPPVIALLGLLGILGGEMLVRHLRGQPAALSQCLHRKDFTPHQSQQSACPTTTDQERI